MLAEPSEQGGSGSGTVLACFPCLPRPTKAPNTAKHSRIKIQKHPETLSEQILNFHVSCGWRSPKPWTMKHIPSPDYCQNCATPSTVGTVSFMEQPELRYRPVRNASEIRQNVLLGKRGTFQNASEMRQKCVKMGLVLLGKEERSKMCQKCVRNARNPFGGEHHLDDTELSRS